MSKLTISAQGNLPMDKAGTMSKTQEMANAKKNFFGGNLNLANDSVEQRRKEAQEKAWNLVKDAWTGDMSVDQMIESRRNHIAQMEDVRKEAVQNVEGIEEDKEVLRQFYEVDTDSQEQKDLELLEKRQNILGGVGFEPLTSEEEKRLKEIEKQPLTEYQQRALDLNDRQIKFKKELYDAESQIMDASADISRIKIERLKSNPMLEAKDQAEKIMKSANDAIIGMLVEEATEHIDEIMEDAEEKAQDAAEKAEKKEEQLEEARLERKLQEAMIAQSKEAVQQAEAEQRRHDTPDMDIDEVLNITKGNHKTDDVKSGLEEIKNSMIILEADLKGIKVDKEM